MAARSIRARAGVGAATAGLALVAPTSASPPATGQLSAAAAAAAALSGEQGCDDELSAKRLSVMVRCRTSQIPDAAYDTPDVNNFGMLHYEVRSFGDEDEAAAAGVAEHSEVGTTLRGSLLYALSFHCVFVCVCVCVSVVIR